MRLSLLASILFLSLETGENANILAVFPLQGKSHFSVFEPLLKGLAARGHQLDVMSHFPQKKSIAGYNDLSLKGTLPFFMNNMTLGTVGNGVVKDFKFTMAEAGSKLCPIVFNTTVARELKNSRKKYDVLITEIFATDCMLGYAHIFDIPAIAMTSSINLPWTSDWFGNPDNPAYIPNYYAPFLAKMNLKERVINTVFNIVTKIGYKVLSMEPSNLYAKTFFGQDLPDLQDLVRNVSLVFVNSHFSIHQSRPFLPNVVEVGGIHITQNESLSQYFVDSLKTDLKGVIYLSFGSMLRTDSFDEEKIRSMFEAFGQLPYKVMWKGDREKFPKTIEVPSNVQFHSWMPQLGILCHPNVKLFVSHGGLLGTQEAIHCGVPVLGIPIFGDQELNTKTSEAQGFAIEVSYESITTQSILSAAKQLLGDPKYKGNADKLSRLFRDRPMSPLETAIYWVEYVIRHNGAPHLRSVGADLPLYQYYLLDVAAVILTAFLSIVAFVYYCVLFVCFVFAFNKNASKLKTK